MAVAVLARHVGQLALDLRLVAGEKLEHRARQHAGGAFHAAAAQEVLGGAQLGFGLGRCRPGGDELDVQLGHLLVDGGPAARRIAQAGIFLKLLDPAFGGQDVFAQGLDLTLQPIVGVQRLADLLVPLHVQVFFGEAVGDQGRLIGRRRRISDPDAVGPAVVAGADIAQQRIDHLLARVADHGDDGGRGCGQRLAQRCDGVVGADQSCDTVEQAGFHDLVAQPLKTGLQCAVLYRRLRLQGQCIDDTACRDPRGDDVDLTPDDRAVDLGVADHALVVGDDGIPDVQRNDRFGPIGRLDGITGADPDRGAEHGQPQDRATAALDRRDDGAKVDFIAFGRAGLGRCRLADGEESISTLIIASIKVWWC